MELCQQSDVGFSIILNEMKLNLCIHHIPQIDLGVCIIKKINVKKKFRKLQSFPSIDKV